MCADYLCCTPGRQRQPEPDSPCSCGRRVDRTCRSQDGSPSRTTAAWRARFWTGPATLARRICVADARQGGTRHVQSAADRSSSGWRRCSAVRCGGAPGCAAAGGNRCHLWRCCCPAVRPRSTGGVTCGVDGAESGARRIPRRTLPVLSPLDPNEVDPVADAVLLITWLAGAGYGAFQIKPWLTARAASR